MQLSYLTSKSSSVQSAVGCAHQEQDYAATNKHARTDHQLSKILVCENSAIIIIILFDS